MRHKPNFRILPLLLIIAVFLLSGCMPVRTSGTAPTPVESYSGEPIENPDIYVDPQEFRGALLGALAARDTEKLRLWMSEPFLTGTWRADLSDSAPADALKALYSEDLSAEPRLALVKNVDLAALMGDKDPLTIPRAEAGVVDVFLVSGWGKDGRDEAVLFVSRQSDNSLKWHGWMLVQGGFSGARLGGAQRFQNNALGFRAYLPQNTEITPPTERGVLFLAPGVGHPSNERAAVIVEVEAANGRTVEDVVGALKAEVGPGYNITQTVLGIDEAQALVVSGLPGQDSNRQVFMVHENLLYRLTFIPDGAQNGEAYWQMEDLYAMVVNTWKFVR